MNNRPTYIDGYRHWVCPVWRTIYECAKWLGIVQIQNFVLDCHLVLFSRGGREGRGSGRPEIICRYSD